MKAAVIESYGGPEVFGFATVPDPSVGSGEVLVRVAAASVNPVDLLDRAGANHGWRPLTFPAVIGWDVSGTVAELGPEVVGLSVGDRVAAWAFHTYAQLVSIRADWLVRVPPEMELADVAALPLVTVTGSQLITVGIRPRPGQTVLVSGATGGVGRTAVFAARDMGARVIAAVRSRHVEEASHLGADMVVAMDDEDALAGLGKFDAVANTVGGAARNRLFDLLAPGGVFASVTGPPDRAEMRQGVRVVSLVSKQDATTLRYAVEAVRQGELQIPISRRLPMANAREAHELVAAEGGSGKVLLVA